MKLFKFLLVITLGAAAPVHLGYSAENAVTYCGSVFSGSSITDVVTKLQFIGQEELRGTYKFLEDGRSVGGTLTSKAPMKNRQAVLIWTDKYGEGSLAVNFSENFDFFDGKWGAGGEVPTNLWQGKKCESTGEPGISS
jgi:hypothetical protein